MKHSTFSLFCLLTLTSVSRGQLSIPLADVGLAYPGISAVTVQLGGSSRSGLPTPFILQGVNPSSALWFCMDPLQTIYYSGSGQPAGSSLYYESRNPSDFDKWTPSAPGLSLARVQNLADLFAAFAPTQTNQLIGGALQLAVWEIANEFNGNAFSLTGGQMKVSGNATLLQTAQNMLDSLDDVGVINRGNVSSLSYLIDGSYHRGRSDEVLVQDLVGYSPVPEPSSYALAGAGLLMSVIVQKKRREKKANA